MIFMNLAFSGSGQYATDGQMKPMEVIPSTDTIDAVVINGGIFDEAEIYGSHKEYDDTAEYAEVMERISEWTNTTLYHALFDDSMDAGTVMYNIDACEAIRTKRRVKGTMDWTVISEVAINEDGTVDNRYDFTASGDTEYEYAIAPIVGNTEGNLMLTEVKSEFKNVFIVGSDEVFGTGLETELTTKLNRPSSVVNTLNAVYPFVIHNSRNKYRSGKFEGLFLDFDKDKCEFKATKTWVPRFAVEDFLADGLPKLIKHPDGRTFLVSISSSSIDESIEDHKEKVLVEFEWVEIGDYTDSDALYDSGLLGVDFRG